MSDMMKVILAVAAIYILVDVMLLLRLKRSFGRRLARWADWCQNEQSGLLTESELLDRLDHSLFQDGNYKMLQRMTVMAPLIGVVLTAIGFITLDVAGPRSSGPVGIESGVDPIQVMRAIRPLFWGVCLGASLALMNQLVLQLATGLVNATRAQAEANLPELERGPADRALARFADRVSSLAGVIGGSVTELVEGTQEQLNAVAKAGERLKAHFDNTADDAAQTAAALESAAGNLDERFARAIDKLDTSTTRFGDKIKDTTDVVAKRMQECHRSLEDAVRSVRQTLDAMRPLVEDISTLVQNINACHQSLLAREQTLQDVVIKSAVASDEMAARIRDSMRASKELRSASASAEKHMRHSASRLHRRLGSGIFGRGSWIWPFRFWRR